MPGKLNSHAYSTQYAKGLITQSSLPNPILQVMPAVEMCDLSKRQQTVAQMDGLTTEHHAAGFVS